jgi:hypothetical protein
VQELGFNLRHPIWGTGLGTPLGQSNPAKAPEAAWHVRRAIEYLVPKDTIIKQVLNGFGSYGITTPITRITAGFDTSIVPRNETVQNATILAQHELEAAGYTFSSPPATITDLAAGAPTTASINLTWTAPGAHAMNGNVTGYLVKYSTFGSITPINWGSATPYGQSWTPAKNGTTETRVVTGLSPGTTYWFAIEAYYRVDNITNFGDVSNSPSAKTLGSLPPYDKRYDNIGVRVGDIADYALNMTGSIPFTYSGIHLYVRSIFKTNVTFAMAACYSNGTTIPLAQMTGNVSIGGSMYSPIWSILIPYSLTAGDPIYYGAPYKINETTTLATCGTTRVVNHLTMTSYSSYLTEVMSIYWDKDTGLMVKYSVYMSFSGTIISENMTLSATSVWSQPAPNPPVDLILIGSNATTPSSFFARYGICLLTCGACNVTVINSNNPFPGTGAAPTGMTALAYLDINGIRLRGSSQITLYVYYNVTMCRQLGIDENTLVLYLWNATSPGHWQALESTHMMVNSTVGVVFAVAPHLSYFAVLGAPAGGSTGIPPSTILIAALLLLGIVAAAVYVMKRRGSSTKTIDVKLP